MLLTLTLRLKTSPCPLIGRAGSNEPTEGVVAVVVAFRFLDFPFMNPGGGNGMGIRPPPVSPVTELSVSTLLLFWTSLSLVAFSSSERTSRPGQLQIRTEHA